MKKQILLGLGLSFLLLLAGCGNNTTNDETNKQTEIKQQEIKQIIENAKIKVNPEEIKQYQKGLKVYTKCITDYCKNDYIKLKEDKIALKYFNELVKKNKAEKIINKNIKTTKEDIVNKIKQVGIKTQSDCAKLSKNYKNIAECIKKNNIKNTTTQKLINMYYGKKIGDVKLDKDLTFWNMINSVCIFWSNHGFKSVKEINKSLESERKAGFNVPNVLIENIKDFERIYNINKKEYSLLISTMCKNDIYKYNEIIKKQNNKPTNK